MFSFALSLYPMHCIISPHIIALDPLVLLGETSSHLFDSSVPPDQVHVVAACTRSHFL